MLYVCVGFWDVEVFPSPKFQAYTVIGPLFPLADEELVKLVACPKHTLPYVKFAVGGVKLFDAVTYQTGTCVYVQHSQGLHVHVA